MDSLDKFIERYPTYIGALERLKQQIAEKDKQILELQEQSIRDNQLYNEELAEKEKEIESLKDNWNILCDYLGNCVVKYDEEDVNGIYGEVLDKVNILKRYDYKRYQDKISFAISSRIRRGCSDVEALTTPVDRSKSRKKNNQIASLKKEQDGK